MTIRNASHDDIRSIKRILSQYLLETEPVDDHIDQFIVAEEKGRIVACAYLDTSQEVVELRSLAVLPGWKNKGIGRQLCEILKVRAASQTGLVYVRTTSEQFFRKIGFVTLDCAQKSMIWHDCAQCDIFNVCLQVPMVLELGSC